MPEAQYGSSAVPPSPRAPQPAAAPVNSFEQIDDDIPSNSHFVTYVLLSPLL